MRVESLMEEAIFSTVRIEARSASTGASGTGFLFLHETNSHHRIFLVTNKHVLEGFEEASVFFTGLKGKGPDVGNRVDVLIEDLPSSWTGHPDASIDVAILDITRLFSELGASGNPVFIKAIGKELIPDDTAMSELDVLEEVVFIGYPNGIYYKVNLVPIVRKGITATPIQLDYDGDPKFMIDASVFPGSSGSPVFLYNSGGFASRTSFVVGNRLMFLGLVASVAYSEREGQIEFKDVPTAVRPFFMQRDLLNLGIVYKSRTIFETIQHLDTQANSQNKKA